MPKLKDLAGTLLGDAWEVLDPAPFVKRVAHWNVKCASCGTLAIRPHVLLQNAIAGKATMPPCDVCSPAAEPEITMGMHRGPDDPAHLVGTPCADGNLVPMDASGQAVALIPLHPDHQGCTRCQTTPCVCAEVFRTTALEEAQLQHQQGWIVWEEPEPEELVQVPKGELIDASTGALRVYGKAEALEEAQEHLDIVRRGVLQPAKPANGHAGMSGLGGCERKVGYRLAFGKPATIAWRPWVGTQAHGEGGSGLNGIYQRENKATMPEEFSVAWRPRWVTNTRVELRGERGIIDLLDTVKAELIDFKVPGITAVRRVYKGEISGAYEAQLDLYALAMVALGYEVKTVGLFVLPAAGEIEDAAWYSRPADFANAVRALDRRDRINAMLAEAVDDANGSKIDVLARLEIEADSCDYCPVRAAKLCEGVDVKPVRGTSAITWDATPVTPPPGVVTNTNLEEK